MDQGRQMTRDQRKLTHRLIVAVASRPRILRVLTGLGRMLWPKRSGLGRMIGIESASADVHGGSRTLSNRDVVGRIGLFEGCTGDIFDRSALEAAKLLLAEAGYEVVVPAAQVCCGAVDAHSGNIVRAKELAKKNEQAFAVMGNLDAIVSIATGCGSQLAEYSGLGAKHKDICEFLAISDNISALHFRPLEKKVVLHLPCTQVNVLGSSNSIKRLLEKIPGLTVELLGKEGGCCGAGGVDFLRQSQTSMALRQPLLQQIEKTVPDVVLSANVSCRLHLRAGDANTRLPYMHPVTLLAQQLIRR
jgi:glycolate oxidase iron-sulfur subunit